MSDQSSELESLHELESSSDDDSFEEHPPAKKARPRAVYQFDREFSTADGFNQWWAVEGYTGWEFVNGHTNKDGIETAFYRQVLLLNSRFNLNILVA